jgi:hypothetical protein
LLNIRDELLAHLHQFLYLLSLRWKKNILVILHYAINNNNNNNNNNNK